MITFFARAVCGCCNVEMHFESEESLKKAFNKVGLQSSATIIDDENTTHEGVDTFYGYWQDGQKEHDLSDLINQVNNAPRRL